MKPLELLALLIDAVIAGSTLYGFLAWRRAKSPEGRRKRLRARCRVWLNADVRSRREFVRIMRLAVETYGVGNVARACGVPIALVFDWTKGTFGEPPSEVYARPHAVSSILFILTASASDLESVTEREAIAATERRALQARAADAAEPSAANG